MSERTYRVYADTSIFGGVFDDEFAAPSRIFFDQVASGRFVLVTSALVQAELDVAPDEVRQLFDEMIIRAETRRGGGAAFAAGLPCRGYRHREVGDRRPARGPGNRERLRTDRELELQTHRPF